MSKTTTTIWTCNNCGTELTDAESDSHECAPATEAQPTPTPWHVASDEVTIVKPHVQANSEFAKQQGYIVARSCFSREESADTPKGGQWTEETKANARFIVKAVNNHQKLVDAAQSVIDNWESGDLAQQVRRLAKVLAEVQDAD